MAIRVIPCLDVKDGRVVKGVNFVGLRDAGDPVELAAEYGRLGADEVPAGPVAPLMALGSGHPPAWRSGSAGDPTTSEAGVVAVLSAEVALLQARLDEMQERIDVLEAGRDDA